MSSRRAAVFLAAVTVVGATTWVIWRINASRNPVDEATILAGDLAAIALAVTLLTGLGTWWLKGSGRGAAATRDPARLDAAADRLAVVVTGMWRKEAAARRIVTPAPATVRWAWASADMAVPRRDVIAPSAAGTGPPPLAGLVEAGEVLGSGVVSRLHDEVYARLPHGRLVLVGAPGSGKSGAMILLLLAALDHRGRLAAGDRAAIPVPVWLTLGEWNPAWHNTAGMGGGRDQPRSPSHDGIRIWRRSCWRTATAGPHRIVPGRLGRNARSYAFCGTQAD